MIKGMSNSEARTLAILSALIAIALAAGAGCLIKCAFHRIRQATARRRGQLLWLAERSRGFWVMATTLPMLYLASFGPVCWSSSRMQPVGQFVNAAYPHLIRIMFHRSTMGYESLLWRYVTVGQETGENSGVGLDADGQPRMSFHFDPVD